MASRPAVPRALKWTGIVAGGLVLALAVALVALREADLRGPVSRMISARIGQPVRITGDLDLHLASFTPRAVVTGLELGNPSWAGTGPMARIERLTVELQLLPLLRGEVVLPLLALERPDIRLVRDSAGRTNWPGRGGRQRQGQAPRLPLVQEFAVTDGRLALVDGVRNLEFTGKVSAQEVAPIQGAPRLRIASHGELNGKPFRLDLRGGALVNARRGRAYPFEYEVTAGGTRMSARGALQRAFDLGAYQAKIAIAGEDVADLYYLVGLALPNTPPYEITGHVQRAGSRLYLRGLTGLIGDSDIDLEATVEMAGERPLVVADVTSSSLDLDDLGAPLGSPPSVREGETASAEQRAQAQALRAKRRLFPDAHLQVNRLRTMDARVQFHASAVKARKVPLREVSFDLKLDRGVLTLDPVSFVLPQGRLAGTAQLDARQDLPKTVLDARLTGLELGQFRPRDAEQAPFEGKLLGRAQLRGYGSSVHQFASTAAGEVTVVVPRGEVREVFAELTGINVARGLGLLMRKDEDQTAVRCGIADFDVKHGTLQAQNILFDTENVLISGRGDIHLASEQYDLSIKGQPKKFRFFRVRSPIAIRGPLRKPDIGLESGDSLTQTGVAAALASLVAPLAAVLAFVDPGLADDANCAALLAAARREGAPVKTADVDKAKRG